MESPKNALLFVTILAIMSLGAVGYYFVRPQNITLPKLDFPQFGFIGGEENLIYNGNTITSDDYYQTDGSDNSYTYANSGGDGSLSDQIDQVSQNAKDVQTEIKRLEAEKNQSPLKGKIFIESVNTISSVDDDPNNEYVVLRANDENDKKVLLTGMTLKSTITGQTVQIKNGTYLPYTNTVNPDQAIFLSSGESTLIITGRSPLGVSFKLNSCMGYLDQYQDFNPGISSSCPRLSNEPLPPPPNNIDDACIDYIDSVRGCEIHVDTPLNFDEENTDPYNQLTHECQIFIEKHTGYSNCVTLHKNDSDFYQGEWHIYLNRTQKTWKDRREFIQLLDQNGKVVDEYTY